MAGRKVDVLALTPDEETKVCEVVRMIAEYHSQKKEIDESITDTLATFTDNLGCDKESAGKLKKLIKQAAVIYGNRKTEEKSEEIVALDRILTKLESPTSN